MAAKKDDRIKSATFFTALIDFSEPGDLGVFIDEQQVGSLEEKMSKDGYLEGKSMSNAFNMLRSNDLIWSFYINNYLMGKDPMVFDLLYWNSDNTRLPAAMHSFYLRNMYIENKFKEPGGVELAGVPIDISKIKIPSYFISTIDDHIAPWKSTYDGAKLLSGPVNFVLGGSGHIAGIINPPAANKYCHWTKKSSSRRRKLPDDPQTWFDETDQHEGSWWPNWQQWISNHDKQKVNARQPGKGKLKAIEDAPGSYVAKRL
jgi:polyhydroxyalkanoate synthase